MSLYVGVGVRSSITFTFYNNTQTQVPHDPSNGAYYAGRALGPRVLNSLDMPKPLRLEVSTTFGVTRSVTIRADSTSNVHTIHYVAISRREEESLDVWSPAIGEQILASRVGVSGVASRGNLTRSDSDWSTSICGLATDMPLEIFVCPEI